MLGPSGFFLPSGPESTDTVSNDLELIHTSKDGFNELYRVCKSGRFFVYKALKEEYRGNPMYEDLLTKDFNIGFSLTHPGLCQYYAKISHPEIGNCIVMEWIDGCTLEELISSGHIDKMLAEKIICETCDALGYMHRRQVIHRDLKPENILITHNGQNVKIIDFGLSDADSFAAFKAPAGTKIYASPELSAGEPIDNRSDIWSLGVIIGEMHAYYRNVAGRCLMRDREKRFASAEDVKRAVLNEGVRKFWKAVLWVAVCGVAAALAAGVIIKGFEPQENAEVSVGAPEHGQPKVSEQARHEYKSKTPEQGGHESVGQTIQAVERAMKTTVSQSSGQAAKDNWTRKDTTAITKGLNHEPEDPSATDQPSSETSTENIDTESLEDLFKEAAGQIL